MNDFGEPFETTEKATFLSSWTLAKDLNALGKQDSSLRSEWHSEKHVFISGLGQFLRAINCDISVEKL